MGHSWSDQRSCQILIPSIKEVYTNKWGTCLETNSERFAICCRSFRWVKFQVWSWNVLLKCLSLFSSKCLFTQDNFATFVELKVPSSLLMVLFCMSFIYISWVTVCYRIRLVYNLNHLTTSSSLRQLSRWLCFLVKTLLFFWNQAEFLCLMEQQKLGVIPLVRILSLSWRH